MRSAVLMSVWAFLPAACTNEIPGETRLPRCEPLSISEPGRLMIEADAEDYGVVRPCRPSIEFAARRNQDPRAVSLVAEFRDLDGNAVVSETLEARFDRQGGGFVFGTADLAPVEGRMCRDLYLHLSGLTCRDGDGAVIECPEIELETSYVFEDFTIGTEGLEVCYD